MYVSLIRDKKIWHNNKYVNIPITLKVYVLKFKIDEAKKTKKNKTKQKTQKFKTN